ncbi:hypothetical protein J32TS6_11130 [Virgibacillus pantothenticus]|uniref:RNA polymerase sigma-70 region 2 domain-containing protein n=1 Tax=Virgibacillus pantothenticus TaxID=1473 RepID=A0A0L0QLY5_VIRPA|nr:MULTISPECIES: sigma-70 family RNA polymerase sigma factor [Virgibacillus]API93292.1 hypothetical protein BKP57_16610 [Virgibacillus sp. 6R]KNE19566.1 hypothetical protein AFK71_13925 [Virgibacillus pantothenticus]MBS7428659.1 sigma-70 family RNA polymerase sigma factor [Virgibacillus sp. 19R1-5]MED3737322.1 sigma-70 family RNA polymerase sigma factor [Virgibacillus pantothenticus]QTY14904.1 sigma-70 family RNA polymerase sigma factor [Virgibacillus pantothenticus]
MEDKKYNSHITFEEIVKQNERRIYYQLHKLNIRDPHQEFYQEGLVAMWNAYETYQPDKGPMATYFNYTIRNRLIDLIRKKGKEQERLNAYIAIQKNMGTSGNYYKTGSQRQFVQPLTGQEMDIEPIIEQAQQLLSRNQLKWFQQFLLQERSIKSISEQEGVSEDAVKSWGREARKKLRAVNDQSMKKSAYIWDVFKVK